MTRLKTLALVVSAALLPVLTGCSALAVGEEEFACQGMPDSVFCRSARDVYHVTSQGVVPSPMKSGAAYNEECDDCINAEEANPELREALEASGVTPSSKPDKSGFVADSSAYQAESARIELSETKGFYRAKDGVVVPKSGDEVIDNFVVPELPERPIPVRTPSQVMRIWIAPYVDMAGDLQAPGYLYTEIEPRRWIYPNGEADMQTRHFDPLASMEALPVIRSGARRNGRALSSPEPTENSLEKFKRSQRSGAY